jgi:exosortase/archaeosortase family protein
MDDIHLGMRFKFGHQITDTNILVLFTAAALGLKIAGQAMSAQDVEGNAGEILGLIATWSVLRPGAKHIVLFNADFVAISLCSLLFLPPYAQTPFIALTIAALYFWVRRRGVPELVSAAQIWIAISCYETWGRSFFSIVSTPIIKLESKMVAAIGRLFHLGLESNSIVITAPSGWSVYVAEGCSSFHNLSLAFLIWLSLIKIAGAEPISRATLTALSGGVVMIIGLNGLRIVLMALSEENYNFWHNGQGAGIFSTLALAVIVAPTMFSLRGVRA